MLTPYILIFLVTYFLYTISNPLFIKISILTVLVILIKRNSNGR
jgi:hypothetical protein